MRPINIENAKKAVDSLCANWEEDEERNYGEMIAYGARYADRRFLHAKDIPTSELLDSNYKDLRVLKDFFNCHITTIHQVLIGVEDGEKYEVLRRLKDIRDAHYKDYLNEDLCEEVNKSNNNAEYDVGYLEGLKQSIQTIGG